MESLKNPKLIAALVVTVLAVIVFYQNSETVDLKVLWIAKLQTSKATAMLGAFLAGVVTGALAFSRWKSKREKAKAESSAAKA
jgi:uncharacterized integral membrane protein